MPQNTVYTALVYFVAGLGDDNIGIPHWRLTLEPLGESLTRHSPHSDANSVRCHVPQHNDANSVRYHVPQHSDSYSVRSDVPPHSDAYSVHCDVPSHSDTSSVRCDVTPHSDANSVRCDVPPHSDAKSVLRDVPRHSDANSYSVRCNWLIDCSGRRSRVSRSHSDVSTLRSDRLVCIYARLSPRGNGN